ncbi:uncharacterized protein LOC131249128 isoform X1 [Magnolia sinica]|uniref:uncharacterized protein LOC131249128 isoform X1 n=1 Tax=Magnolia sinica TaxID=86752 RepID=UPI002658A323|nr:uncharacterized protein LOC131249128 isoform X1 [Magnolia sinica]
MSESTVYPQRVLFGEENVDEDLAVLPRRTKVVVTGNNRTRSVLVGLHGVVKKAVGLGGWHWLVLTNGDEVKVQRNALSVIEVPTGDEDGDEWEDFSYSGSDLGSRSTPRRTLTADLRKLETASLWKYWRHFKLDEVNYRNYHPSKEQLLEAVERHFVSQQLDEFQVIADFLHAAKRLKQLHGLSG